MEPDFVVTAWSCSDLGSTTECDAVASSTVDQPTYLDWVVMNSFFLFFLSFLVWGLLFAEFGRKYRKMP